MPARGIFEHRLLSEATRETEKTSSCRPDFSPRFDDPSSKISGRRKQKHPLWFAGKICEHHGLELRKSYLPPEARLARQLNLQHAYVSYAAIVIRRALECYDLRSVKGKFVLSWAGWNFELKHAEHDWVVSRRDDEASDLLVIGWPIQLWYLFTVQPWQ